MRIILILITLSIFSSCTTHQKVTETIDEANRVLKERADGVKKISEAKANFNPHRIMQIKIPKPKKKTSPSPAPVVEKKAPDIFESTPKGMVKEGSNGR